MAATPIHTGARSNAKLFFFFVKAAAVAVGHYDWAAVTDSVLDVYDMALSTAHTRVEPAPGSRTMLGRLRDALDD